MVNEPNFNSSVCPARPYIQQVLSIVLNVFVLFIWAWMQGITNVMRIMTWLHLLALILFPFVIYQTQYHWPVEWIIKRRASSNEFQIFGIWNVLSNDISIGKGEILVIIRSNGTA